ncbi:MAG TPA: DUF1015 family protein [Acidobacteriota bacterium]|nr:DUF1015 family protein [Acidobacteriota bacterium]
MQLIRSFRALRSTPESAGRVAAPPYDVLDSEEARLLVGENADSFLHVSKPEIDFPPGTDPHAPEVHARGRANLDRLIGDGLLCRDDAPCLYVYRLVMGEHTQTGVVVAASVAAYLDGRIRLHEHTKDDKVDDRARNADALDAHTGTLFLTHRADSEIDGLVAGCVAQQATVDVTGEDGVRHTLWVVSEPVALAAAFNAMPAVYIADGHHRSAAAAKLYEWRQERRAAGEDVGGADWFLAVIFPDDQVQILPYNRVVSTLGGRTADELVAALRDAFTVAPSGDAVQPERPGVFGLYLAGRWYRLEIAASRVPADALGRLDINLLGANCLGPLLGIEDQRTDDRIDFVGGIRGLVELERRVDSGEMKAAFSLYPTQLADVLTVADLGQVMPPKSTWFEPKLRDGLVVLPL